MEKELQKDRWYVISAATAGTLMLKTDGADIPVEYSAGQTTFYAATGKYECEDASIIISGPFNGAPASGLGGGSLSPAEQAAVTSLASGTINSAGALNVHAASILTYGAPIDTMGGDVYHRDGSATFAGTEGGNNYSAVIDFKHFEVRKNGELIVHFHESNNKPVLELGGSPVPTVRQQAANALLSNLTYGTLCASADSDWLKNALRDCVNGDTAYVDLSAFAPSLSESARYYTTDTPLFAGDSATNKIRLGEGVDGLKRMVLKINNNYRVGGASMLLCNSDVDFTIISKGWGLWAFESVKAPGSLNRAKSLTVISTDSTGNPATYYGLGGFSTSYTPTLDESCFHFPIKFIVPAYTSGAAFIIRTYHVDLQDRWQDDYPLSLTHLDITAAMPSYVSSFSFYKTNFNTPENLVYLMDNLGKPAADSEPKLEFGIDAALVDMSDPAAAPVYFDNNLQAAVERFRAKGWLDMPKPLSEALS